MTHDPAATGLVDAAELFRENSRFFLGPPMNVCFVKRERERDRQTHTHTQREREREREREGQERATAT